MGLGFLGWYWTVRWGSARHGRVHLLSIKVTSKGWRTGLWQAYRTDLFTHTHALSSASNILISGHHFNFSGNTNLPQMMTIKSVSYL